jgi:hypothetical protein
LVSAAEQAAHRMTERTRTTSFFMVVNGLT